VTPRRPLAFRPGCAAADEAVVEGRPVLQLSDAAIDAFCNLYADILVDALVRQERGADVVEAVRAALAAAETTEGSLLMGRGRSATSRALIDGACAVLEEIDKT